MSCIPAPRAWRVSAVGNAVRGAWGVGGLDAGNRATLISIDAPTRQVEVGHAFLQLKQGNPLHGGGGGISVNLSEMVRV